MALETKSKHDVLKSFEVGMPIKTIAQIYGLSPYAVSKELSVMGYRDRPIDEKKVMLEYEKLGQVKLVCEKLNLEIHEVLLTLMINNVVINQSFISYTKIPPQDIINLYESGWSSLEIGRYYGCWDSNIRQLLRKSGTKMRENKRQRKFNCNENFFETIDTEEKSYWLGFMYSDGFIKSNLKNFGVSLHVKDVEHLEKFKQHLDYDGDVKIYTQKHTTFVDNYKYASLVVCNEKICRDLISHGCVPKKTHILEPPIGIPDNLIRHFVRGVVDGDGYISLNGPSALEIAGTFLVLDWISKYGPFQNKPLPFKTIWRLRYGGEKANKWLHYLYDDCTVYLDRKYERFLKIC